MITIWPLYFLRRQSFNRLPRLCICSLRSIARIIWHWHISPCLKNAMKIRRQSILHKMSIATYNTESGSNDSNHQLGQRNSKIFAIDNTYLRIDFIQVVYLSYLKDSAPLKWWHIMNLQTFIWNLHHTRNILVEWLHENICYSQFIIHSNEVQIPILLINHSFMSWNVYIHVAYRKLTE